MEGQVARIDDVLLEELRKIWEWGKPVSEIIKRLRQEFHIKQRGGWERLVLYGRTRDDEMIEHVVGWLGAIAPGIVILEANSEDALSPLSGLLERVESGHPQLFSLRPFSPSHISAGLTIWPSTFPKKNRRFEVCPAWIDWHIGAGHGEEYMTLGIEPGRWEVLEQWLDKWLPKP